MQDDNKYPLIGWLKEEIDDNDRLSGDENIDIEYFKLNEFKVSIFNNKFGDKYDYLLEFGDEEISHTDKNEYLKEEAIELGLTCLHTFLTQTLNELNVYLDGYRIKEL